MIETGQRVEWRWIPCGSAPDTSTRVRARACAQTRRNEYTTGRWADRQANHTLLRELSLPSLPSRSSCVRASGASRLHIGCDSLVRLLPQTATDVPLPQARPVSHTRKLVFNSRLEYLGLWPMHGNHVDSLTDFRPFETWLFPVRFTPRFVSFENISVETFCHF